MQYWKFTFSTSFSYKDKFPLNMIVPFNITSAIKIEMNIWKVIKIWWNKTEIDRLMSRFQSWPKNICDIIIIFLLSHKTYTVTEHWIETIFLVCSVRNPAFSEWFQFDLNAPRFELVINKFWNYQLWKVNSFVNRLSKISCLIFKISFWAIKFSSSTQLLPRNLVLIALCFNQRF